MLSAVTEPRVRVDVLRDEADDRASLYDATLRGLRAGVKELPAVWLYDEQGSRLYEEITRLPEYYLPRREAEILRDRADVIAKRTQARALVELAVDRRERVPRERLGHANVVVVRGFQSCEVFHEVEAEQERITCERGQKVRPLLGVEVPDRASEEGDQRAPVSWERAEMPLEVTDNCVDEDPRVGSRDRLRARSQGLLAHVERNKALERARRVERA